MADPNPYASPVEVQDSFVASVEPVSVGRSFLRWLLICSFSAAPSFFLGLSFGSDIYHVSAMIFGVLTYVVLYVYLEHRVWTTIAHRTALRRSMRIGYGARVVASILFPVAVFVDMPCGILATSITSLIPRAAVFVNLNSVNESATGPGAFVAIFMTTILQGALMHLVLGGFIGIVHAIQLASGLSPQDKVVDALEQ